MPKYDPRKPRANKEIPDILRCVERCQADLQAAKTHSQMRGHAMVLRAHLEQLLDEPEFHTDLIEGTVEARKLLTGPKIEKDAPFTGQWPFEQVGSSQNLYFFYANGSVSQLYEGPAIDPYQVHELWSFGPYTYSLEQLFCTEAETENHLAGPQILARLVNKGKGKGMDTPYWLFCDPRGVWGGSTELVKAYASEGPALKAAKRLSERLGIRFWVGRLCYLNCTR